MSQQIEDLKVIREIMEKSTKFLSLSGLSGIAAGVIAIIGAAFAWFYLLREPSLTNYNRMQEIGILLGDAVIILLLAVAFGVFFSYRKARKNGEKLFNKITYRILYNLAVPLITGGIFCLIFLLRGYVEVAICGTLIFYGLALVNVSKYTFDEIHYLGLTEIILGLIATLFMRYGILFWTLGFGVCHILYGLIMYIKYDLKKK
jgi:hypothetical protein